MLPYYYNNNQSFLQKRLDQKIIRDTKIFEKTQIKWFTFDDIKKQHDEFRSFYKNIVHLILGNRSAIEGFIKKSLNKKGFGKKTKFNRRKFTKKTRKYRK
jgi:transcription termination factor NusB